MQSIISGNKILVTKKQDEAEKSFLRIKEAGAEIVYFPTISIVSRIENDEVKSKLLKSYLYDYLIFTSGSAAEVFYTAVNKYKLDLACCKIAAVGKNTADKCRGLGFYIHIIPEEFSSKGLLKIFSSFDLAGKKILIPGSSLSREDLKIGLTELGAEVDFIPIYDIEENDNDNLRNELDKIEMPDGSIYVFTSPSSFHNFINLFNSEYIENIFENKIICAIGSTTEKAILEHNISVNIVPNVFSLDGVVEAIFEYYNVTKNSV